MKLTVPTMLTLLRIVMIPVLVLVFYLPYKWTNFASAAVFGLAALTDWLDGWIARRYHQYSAFGAFLDPVADKLMVAGALLVLVQVDRVNAILAFIISWNNYILPLYVLNSQANYTLPLGVQQFSSQYSQDTARVLAFTSLSMLPALAFFAVFQRRIVGGLTGAVKG